MIRPTMTRKLTAALVMVLGASALSQPRIVPAQEPDFDVLIVNGRVVDGSGNPDFAADVGIRGDRIVRVGRLEGATARRIIDAGGLHVAPGFIDLHSHALRSYPPRTPEARLAYNLITQGITTVTGGADGRNVAWPISAEMALVRELGSALNTVHLVGVSDVHREVMGGVGRPATAAEINRMRELVRQGLEEGAWGLGAGLEGPDRASPEAVLEMAKVVAEYDGYYVAHQRVDGGRLAAWQVPSTVDGWPLDGLDGLLETIRIAKETGIRVVASHIKAKGHSWGRAAMDVMQVDLARQAGHEVFLDLYPYRTFGSGPAGLIPDWALEGPHPKLQEGATAWGSDGRENLQRNLSDPEARALVEADIEYLIGVQGGADRIYVVDHPDESLQGKTLAEVAADRGVSTVEVLVDFSLTGYEDRSEGAWLRGLAMHEMDIVYYMKQDYTAISSDAGIADVPGGDQVDNPASHPRNYGNYPRVIGEYVRDKGVVSLPFAIRAATSLPAHIIGLPDRGYLKEGYKADLVVFDFERINDRATVVEPKQFSEGVEYVLVNGELVLDRGRHTGALPGIVIDRNEVQRTTATDDRD